MATVFQKPNKRLIITAVAGTAMLLLRRNRFFGGIARFAFIFSLRQWSKAEYISGANRFRKVLGAAGIFIAQTFATYRKRIKK